MAIFSQSTLECTHRKMTRAQRAEGVSKAVGKRIRDLRKKKGWSQEQLVDEAAMHRTYRWGSSRVGETPLCST